jgi:hypothetical protein
VSLVCRFSSVTLPLPLSAYLLPPLSHFLFPSHASFAPFFSTLGHPAKPSSPPQSDPHHETCERKSSTSTSGSDRPLPLRPRLTMTIEAVRKRVYRQAQGSRPSTPRPSSRLQRDLRTDRRRASVEGARLLARMMMLFCGEGYRREDADRAGERGRESE